MPILAFESKKERKENSRSKIGRKQKEKERKFPIKDRKKTKEICKKVFGHTISEQYRVVTTK